MRYSIKAMQVFEVAARLQSFKGAAELLGLTPTAVSHQIKNLEQALDITLFERKTRQVLLTSEGAQLAKAASRGFQTIERAIERIKPAQTLSVSCTSSFASLFLIPHLRSFKHQYPQHDITLISGEAIDTQINSLPIRFGNIDNTNSADVLWQEKFQVFSRAIKTSTSADTLFITQWKNTALETPQLNDWQQANPHYLLPQHITAFDQELYGIQEALAGNGDVFCGELLARQFVRSGLLTPVGEHALHVPLGYYIPDLAQRRTSKNNAFIDWLIACIKSSN